MLKKLCIFFLFIFVFSTGTIVGSHFKNQIDRQKNKVTQSIKELAPDEDYYEQQAKYDEVSDPEAEEIEEEEEPEPRKIVKKSKPMPQKRKVAKKPRTRPKKSYQASKGKYTVQVASFPSSALAKEMARKLKAQGHNSQVFSAVVKGKRWYRVGIGSFSSVGDANKKQRQLVLDKVARSSIISKMN